jgi:hypothetical protein
LKNNEYTHNVLIQVTGGKTLFINAVISALQPDTLKLKELWRIKPNFSTKKIETVILNKKNNECYYAITDSLNTLSLYTKSGINIWSKHLRNEILDKLYTIDFYNNKKCQLLFNTADSLYLIDRLGRSVEGYPIKFKQKVLSGACLIENTNKKKEKIAFIDATNNLVLIDKKGKKYISVKLNNELKNGNYNLKPVAYKNRNYLIVKNKSWLKVFNEKGNECYKTYENIRWSVNNELYETTAQNMLRFVGTNEQGIISYLYPDGHTEKLYCGNYFANHKFEFYNTTNSLINIAIADSNRLYLYNNNKLQLELTENNIIKETKIIDQQLCVLTEKGTLNIYNFNGELQISLNGVSHFTLEKMGENEKYSLLICKFNNFLYYYRIYFKNR